MSFLFLFRTCGKRGLPPCELRVKLQNKNVNRLIIVCFNKKKCIPPGCAVRCRRHSCRPVTSLRGFPVSCLACVSSARAVRPAIVKKIRRSGIPFRRVGCRGIVTCRLVPFSADDVLCFVAMAYSPMPFFLIAASIFFMMSLGMAFLFTM